MVKCQSKKPDDLVVLGARIWRVTGVYIGAVGQESVVGLVALDRSLPHVGEDEVTEMIVPEALVEGHVYSRAPDPHQHGGKGA